MFGSDHEKTRKVMAEWGNNQNNRAWKRKKPKNRE